MKASFAAVGVSFLLLSGSHGRAQDSFVPGGIDSVGLSRIVPDTMVHDMEGQAALGNWEPFASVLGNSVFLIEGNTFAEGSSDHQRYVVAFQPVTGGDPVAGEAFFADDGTPFTGPVNNYRQNGNPGRVAGDKRPGATNFIAGGETSVNEIAEFQSDERWDTGVVRAGRFATVQTHSLSGDPLVQAAQCKAFDAINGRITEGGDPANNQIGRFGGDLACLDNGNFVVVVDDRSKLHHPSDKAATAVIVAPDGSIVKESFVIAPLEIWSNVAAYQGGFCVRVGGILKFYDNDGVLQGEADQADPNLVDAFGAAISFDRGRGDGTRIAAHINSPYVFLAGKVSSDIYIAVWDSRDQVYLANANVNELTEASGGTDEADFRTTFDRVNLAVDALSRVVVTYEATPAGALAAQTAARVLAFDEEAGTFSYLTSTFFPFVNHDDGSGEVTGTPIRTIRPSPALTTREICVAAKGEINSINDPSLGADTPMETNFYTVISHPDPKDDPTPPVGGPKGDFKRGDANNDGKVDISDAVFILGHLFLGGPRWVCEEGSDINDDTKSDISDPVYVLGFLFLGGPAPKAPFPECGPDPGGATCPESKCNEVP